MVIVLHPSSGVIIAILLRLPVKAFVSDSIIKKYRLGASGQVLKPPDFVFWYVYLLMLVR